MDSQQLVKLSLARLSPSLSYPFESKNYSMNFKLNHWLEKVTKSISNTNLWGGEIEQSQKRKNCPDLTAASDLYKSV